MAVVGFWNGAMVGAASGFAAGAVGSVVASGAQGVLKSASSFWKAAGTIAAGSLSGGVGSVIAGGKFWDGFRNGAISSSLNHVVHQLKQKLNYYFDKKKDAYNYAVEESNDGSILSREVSGFALENGDYIVLDPENNTKKKSFNNQIPARYKSGVLQVKYAGEWYNVKSQFHTHPSDMNYASGRIGVSKADLSLLFNRFKGASMSILYRGNEWIVSNGNQFNKYGYNYSLTNNGPW